MSPIAIVGRAFLILTLATSILTFSAASTLFRSTNSIIENTHSEIVLVRPPDPSYKYYESYLSERVDEDSVILRISPRSFREPGTVPQFWEMVDTPRYLLSSSTETIEAEVNYYIYHGHWSERVILEKLYYGLLFGSTGEGPPLDVIGTTNAVPFNHRIKADTKYASGFDHLTEAKLMQENYHVPIPVEYIIETDAIKRWQTGDPESDYCEWDGITCRDSNIVGIDLSNLGLEGTLPYSLCDLSYLEKLNLSGNKIRGTIPSSWTSLMRIQHFKLENNKLTGTVPKGFSRFTDLSDIRINNNQLEGEFPDISNWHVLQFLDVSDNSFIGTILSQFPTQNPWLISFKISDNNFQGSLPSSDDLSMMKKLMVFKANKNQLTGTIPDEWFELPQLTQLSISHNDLVGTIPTEILLASSLKILDLKRNRITGTIPRGDDVIPLKGMAHTGAPIGGMWSDLSNLAVFDMHNNGLTGVLPPEMLYGLRDSLKTLDLGFNAMWGKIPKEIERLTKLGYFKLNSNYFSGTIPSEMNRFSSSLKLNLTDNHFVGTVPKTFCTAETDVHRDFGCDAVLCPAGTFHPEGAATAQSGCRPCTVTYEGESLDPPRSQILGRVQCDHVRFIQGDLNGDGVLSNREVLRLLFVNTVGRNWGEQFLSWADMRIKACDLPGVTCTGKSVTKLDFSGANMCSDGANQKIRTGECVGIPAEISKLSSLETIIFHHRQFLQGSIPSEIGQLTRLKILDFTGCSSLTGPIPSEIGMLTRLKFLSFSGSQMTGTLAPELFDLPKLEKFHLSVVPIEGTIPSTIGNLSKIRELLVSRNNLEGSIPSEVGELTSLENLEIYGNSIVGTIPETITKCTSLKRLDFFNNHLTGPIPDGLSEISTLQIIHLKMNELTGTIPSNFGNLELLSWFDVSSNKLHGTIPPTFGSARSLKDFRVGDNMIYNPVPQSLCTNWNVNNGAAKTYGCAGIVCPIGTYSTTGHASQHEGCQKCSSGQTNMYLGSSSCERFTEKDFLSIFFELMRGHEWEDGQKENWQDHTVDVCQWAGITCDENEENIMSIKFPLSTYYA